MTKQLTCELYGGPLDGIEMSMPEKLMESARVVAIPVNLSPEDGMIKIQEIKPQFSSTTAIYVRTSEHTFKFKEITDGTADIATHD